MSIKSTQKDYEGLQVVPPYAGLESPVTRDLKFQPYSANTAYGGPMNVQPPPQSYNETSNETRSIPETPPPAFHLINEYKLGSKNTIPPDSVHSAPKKRICGLKKRTFWILLLLTLLAVLALAIGLGVGLSNSSTKKSTSTPNPTNTSTPTNSSSSSPVSAIPIPSPTGQFCIAGTGPNNFLGLCNFCCNFGYCPTPCTCTAYSANAVPAPPVTNTPGFPLPGEDIAYVGLCGFTCNHGYCPEAACTTLLGSNSSSSAAVTSSSASQAQVSSSSESKGNSADSQSGRPTSTVVVMVDGPKTATVTG